MARNMFILAVACFAISACASTGSKTASGTSAPAATTAAPAAKVVVANPGAAIALDGQANFRELGGYAAAGGKIVKRGMLFRSGDLGKLSDADLKKIAGLGITCDFDLRGDSEIAASPDKIPDGVAYLNLPLMTNLGDTNALMGDILSGKVDGKKWLTDSYSQIESLNLTAWKAIFNTLTLGKPVLWHCTAGKDRAGMTAALILSALGVDRKTIIDDYLKSGENLKAQNEATVAGLNSKGMPGDKLLPLLGVEKEYIEAFFAGIEAKYGSVDKFLTDTLGVDEAKLRALYLQ